MISLKRLFTGLTIFSFFLILGGCGGGGGSDGSSDGTGGQSDSGTSYSGLTSQAEINQNNAQPLVAGAFESGQVGTVMTVKAEYQDNPDTEPDNIRTLRVPFALSEAARILDLSSPFYSGLYQSRAVRKADGTESGACGGKFKFKLRINESTGIFNGSFKFSDYCEQGIAISGSTEVRGRFDLESGEILTIRFEFSNLSDGYMIMDGKIFADFSDTPILCTMDAYFQDLGTSKVYWIHEYSLNINDFWDHIEFEVFGTYYNPDYGYVTVSTKVPFIIERGDQWPVSGVLVVEGKNRTEAVLETLDDSTCRITADFNGDGICEGESGALEWELLGQELKLVGNANKQIKNLDYHVIDAEYSRQLDRIIMLSPGPDRLHIYDPDTEETASLDLPHPPNCVSVSPDGRMAAVGYYEAISYVNLESVSIEKTLSVSCDAADIVLAGNGYVYAIPREHTWEYIRSIHLETGMETLSSRYIHADARAKLHPGGKAIYGADRGISPSDLEKYDIDNGTAQYLYESSYHGDYPVCGELWISEDGLKIFTRCGNVFGTSEIQIEDMIYDTRLSELSKIEYLAHSMAANKIIAIPGNEYNTQDINIEIQLYVYDPISFESTIPLPKFEVSRNKYLSHGKFVFINSTGSKYHVVVEADAYSGLSHPFGVVSYDMK